MKVLQSNIIFENDRTILKNAQDFIPAKVFDCGQCFRFDRKSDGSYFGVAKERYIEVKQENCDIILENCTKDDFEKCFSDYFDLSFDYSLARESLSVDATLKKASDFGKGIRILHQDEWETLCSFIISQNNNIPRIKGIIKNLCRTYGKEIYTDENGEKHYSFPDAETVAKAGISGMNNLRCGFRSKYIWDAATKVANGEIDLSLPYLMSYEDACRYLMQIKGVGLKVASCVCLFAYRKYDAFPVDVWVRRILDKYYDGKVGAEYFGKYAGLSQQYLFYYERCENNIYLN